MKSCVLGPILKGSTNNHRGAWGCMVQNEKRICSGGRRKLKMSKEPSKRKKNYVQSI